MHLKHMYTEQIITEYLVGSLRGEEAERLDELSITDDDFSDMLRNIENDLVDSYVNAEMDASTRAKFESHYLVSPLRRKKIEFANAFQNFAATKSVSHATGAVAGKIETPEKGIVAKWLSFVSGFAVSRPMLQWGFAAVVLALVGFGGWWVFQRDYGNSMQAGQTESGPNEKQEPPRVNGTSENTTRSTGEIARANENEKLETNVKTDPQPVKTPIKSPPALKPVIASFVLAPQMRSGSQIKIVSMPAEADTAAVALQMEADDFTAYSVALREQSSGRILWRRSKLRARSRGGSKVLNVSFPAGLLKAQVYSLVVSGVSAPEKPEENISDYTFRIVR